MKKQTFIDLDESNTNEINFIIVGKPNSGKSTLFNNLLKVSNIPISSIIWFLGLLSIRLLESMSILCLHTF